MPLYGWAIAFTAIALGFLLSDLVQGTLGFETLSVVLQYGFVFLFLPAILSCMPAAFRVRASKYFLDGVLVVSTIGAVAYLLLPSAYERAVSLGLFIGGNRLGSFVGANGLAKTIAVSVPLLAICHHCGECSKRYVYAWIACCGSALALSASFGGILSTATAGLLVLGPTIVSLYKRSALRTTMRLGIFAGVALFCYSVIALPSLTENHWHSFSRIQKVLDSGDLSHAGSFSDKRHLMTLALDLIADSPVIGVGSQQFSVATRQDSSVHNSYLLVWSEGGILALMGYLAVIGTSITLSLSHLRNATNTRSRLIGWAVFVCLAVYSLNSITNTHAYPRFFVLPILLSVLAMGGYRLKRAPQGTAKPHTAQAIGRA